MTSSIWDSGGIWTPGGAVWRTLGRCKCGGEEVCDEEAGKNWHIEFPWGIFTIIEAFICHLCICHFHEFVS